MPAAAGMTGKSQTLICGLRDYMHVPCTLIERSVLLVAWQSLALKGLHASMQMQRARAENVPIRIRLPDGSKKEGVKGVTTPQAILQQLPRSVAKKAVVAKVDGRVWDLFAPLEGDCDLQILSFEDPEGKEVLLLLFFRHHHSGNAQSPHAHGCRCTSWAMHDTVLFWNLLWKTMHCGTGVAPGPMSEATIMSLPSVQTFWHSSAHVLGEALESCFGAQLTISPA